MNLKSLQPEPVVDKVFVPEETGITHVSQSDRHGSPLELAAIYWAGNTGIPTIIFGAILFTFQLNLWQLLLAAAIGIVGSYIIVGYLSHAGVRGGSPMMTLSRAVFGYQGNKLPTCVSWINQLFWETLLTITAAYAILGLFTQAGLPYNLVTQLGAILMFMILVGAASYLGHATLVWIQILCTILFTLLTIWLVALLVPQINWAKISNAPADWVSFIAAVTVITVLTGASWFNAAGDYSRYLPQDKAPRGIVIRWTVLGAFTPVFGLTVVGFLISSRLPNLAVSNDPISLIGGILPGWFGTIYLLITAGSLIAGMALTLYSSGLNLLALGVRIKRKISVTIDAVIIFIAAGLIIATGGSFAGILLSCAQLLAVGLIPWAAVFLLTGPRSFDANSLLDKTSTSQYYYWHGINAWALTAFLTGSIVALLFTSTQYVSGPFAQGIFATSNLGLLLGVVISIVLTLSFRAFGLLKRPEYTPTERTQNGPTRLP